MADLDPTTANTDEPSRKNRPTPTRKQAEAERRLRLNPMADPKQAKAFEKEQRAKERELRMRTRKKVYQEIEESKPRQLLRDVIDSRFNFGEIILPLMLVVMLLTFIPGTIQYATWLMYLMWGFMGLLIIDTALMWNKFKQLVNERFPGTELKGYGVYGFNRQLAMRRWRKPAPRVKRGDPI